MQSTDQDTTSTRFHCLERWVNPVFSKDPCYSNGAERVLGVLLYWLPGLWGQYLTCRFWSGGCNQNTGS